MRKKETRHDFFYKKAKRERYKSRAVYKLEEIHRRFQIFKRGMKIVDLCAAPGGWSQFAYQKVGAEGRVIAVDLQPINLPEVISVVGDITKEETILKIEELVQGELDVLLADCSPNVSGHWGTDHVRQIFLAEKGLEIATRLLSKNGVFICKMFQGDLSKEFIHTVQEKFKKIRTIKPKASRKQSAEMYLIARERQR
ncbi:MAG: RlmE family RNA methyltransferase [Candidatus Heimdallarchaeota archaeon]